MSPGSIMPPYPWLAKSHVDTDVTPAKIRAMQTLGVPYPEGYDSQAVADMQAQVDKIVLGLKDAGITADSKSKLIPDRLPAASGHRYQSANCAPGDAMIQEVLKSIEGVAIYPMIGLFLFLGGFIAIVFITWRMKPGEVDYVSRLPLDDGRTERVKGETGEVGRTES
jgi:hypothetical protein